MKKHLIFALAALVIIVGAVIVFRKHPAQPVQTPTATSTVATSTTATTPTKTPALADTAWSVFQNYLTAAKNRNLPALTKLSYQLSATCKDPAQQTACFQKMDAAYTAGKDFTRADFTHIASDSKQIILYTDWNTVYNSDVTITARSLIFFVRNSSGAPLLLSFNPSQAEYVNHKDASGKVLTQAQIDALVASSTAADDKALTKDSDGNGFWDSIQSLFY